MGVVWALPDGVFRSSPEKFVMLALAECTNGATGRCCPSVEYIGRRVQLSKRQVIRHIDALVEAGWVTKSRRDRRGDGTLGVWNYSLNLAQVTPTSSGAQRSPKTGSQVTCTSSGEVTCTSSGEVTCTSSQEPEVEPEVEPLPPPTPPSAALEVPPAAGGFDEWWKLYPRKVGKGAARKAYERALRKADPVVLLAAVVRARDAYNDQAAKRGSHRFTPHPSTWLNEERWEDEEAEVADYYARRRRQLAQAASRGASGHHPPTEGLGGDPGASGAEWRATDVKEVGRGSE